MVLKIYIKSFKNTCEGVPFLLTFQEKKSATLLKIYSITDNIFENYAMRVCRGRREGRAIQVAERFAS